MSTLKQAGHIVWLAGCLISIPCLLLRPTSRTWHVIRGAFTIYLIGHAISRVMALLEESVGSQLAVTLCISLAGLAYMVLGAAMISPAWHCPSLVKGTIIFVAVCFLCLVMACSMLASQGEEYEYLTISVYTTSVVIALVGLATAVCRHRKEDLTRCISISVAAGFGVVDALGELWLFQSLGASEDVAYVLARTLDTLFWLPGAVYFFRWLDDKPMYHHDSGCSALLCSTKRGEASSTISATCEGH